ncbi:MAG: hypothetical protein AAB529_00945 [Patescibacteria group bacterium]
MKKISLSTILLLLFLIFVFIPVLASAQGLVPCGKAADGSDACTINDFFIMLARIFNFIVKFIAAPLAVLMLTIGGVIILISAGNPNLAGLGKKILWVSVIGLVLVFGSWLIISFILGALGYTRAWNVL